LDSECHAPACRNERTKVISDRIDISARFCDLLTEEISFFQFLIYKAEAAHSRIDPKGARGGDVQFSVSF
jgi:hypothetical protein